MQDKIIELEIQKSKIKTNHISHFILTLFTGVWAFVWVMAIFINQSKIKDIDNQIKMLKLYENR